MSSFRPRDLASRMARRGRDAPDGFIRETFLLPREEARAKARAFLKSYPTAAYMSEVGRWRELPDGASNSPCADCGPPTETI
jgi:hypothetical protein